jgi:hypothetical protein
MDYFNEIVQNKISAPEMLGAFDKLNFPTPDNTIVLTSDAINLLLASSEKIIGFIRDPEEVNKSTTILASITCNAFTAGMIAGMARQLGDPLEWVPGDPQYMIVTETPEDM